jgi:hypothetical protein
MKCQLPNRDQRMDDFLMGRLSQQEADDYEIHLFGCTECLAELRMREQAITLIKQERESLIADYAQDKPSKEGGVLAIFFGNLLERWPAVWVYAGAAVAVLIIGIIVQQVLQKKNSGDQYAASFAASPVLESLIEQAKRSSSIVITVRSPENGRNFTDDIPFQWEFKKEDGNEFTELVDFKIMNNRETVVFSARIDGREFRLSETLSPGLYYWTIELQGETLYLGKFFFKKTQND